MELPIEAAGARPGAGVWNQLKKRGVFISPDGVGCIWLRHDLKRRLTRWRPKAAQENLVITEDTVVGRWREPIRKRKRSVTSWVKAMGEAGMTIRRVGGKEALYNRKAPFRLMAGNGASSGNLSI